MSRLRQIFGLAVACLLLFAACTPGASDDPNAPTPPPSTTDAVNVAKSFLDYWVQGDFKSMYGLLTPKGQEMALADFTSTYEGIKNTLRLSDVDGLSYTLSGDPERQGTTAIIHYDMTFNSGPVGKFTDPNRIIRLVLTRDRGWRVAWSTMDIFDGLAGGAGLNLEVDPPPRGVIYDRNGKVIAQDGTPNVAVRLVTTAYPQTQQDCFYKLADTFRLNAAELEAEYGPFQGLQFGFTIGHLSQADWDSKQNELLAVCKLDIVPEITRFYYGGGLAPQTIGYVGPIPADQIEDIAKYGASALIGRDGVEQKWNTQLAGESGASLVIRMPDGTQVRNIFSKDSSPGQNVTVTIDRELQLEVERAIAGAYSNANWAPYSTGAAAVVLDVNTGEVLAMASYPSIDPDALLTTTAFDVNDTGVVVLQKYQKTRAFTNRAIAELYAAGSVFKVVSTAAAADSKTFKMSDIYTCNGTWDGTALSDSLRKDWIYLDKYVEQKFHGPITLQLALTSSCDAYYWHVGQRFYDDQHNDLLQIYGNRMGLGVQTGIDIGNEAAGYIPSPETKFTLTGVRWGLGDTLNTIIGQGDVKVTPVQIARMMMGVANGGTLYYPYVVKSVGNPGETPTYIAQPKPAAQISIDPNVMAGIEAGLCDVTRFVKMPNTQNQEFGTAHYVFYNWDFSQVSICGKTGTAQTGAPQPNGWFASYAGKVDPKTGIAKPEIAIAVIVERSREGSETAGPITRRIVEAYYGIQPQEPWPYFWTGEYDPMTDPSASDGGGPPPRNR